MKVVLNWVKADVPRTPDAFARHVYRTAQKIDEWAGENYEGTSVLAGAKAMIGFGLLREYRWAFSVEDVTDAVLAKGPVVIGIPWYDGMYEAPYGLLKVRGELVGGHCLTVVGYAVKSGGVKVGDTFLYNPFDEDAFVLQNSWGESWGVKGLALIRKSALAELLKDEGEACVPVRRSYGIFQKKN